MFDEIKKSMKAGGYAGMVKALSETSDEKWEALKAEVEKRRKELADG